MTASMTHGATMSPIPAFSPTKGLACITQEKITAFHGVPTMFIAMLGHKDFPLYVINGISSEVGIKIERNI